MSTPAPASLYVPRSKRLPGKPVAKRATVMEAPSYEATLTVELCLRLTVSGVRGVCGVRDDAVAEYLAMLTQSAMEAARLERLNAPTLVPPASIDAALLDAVEGDDASATHDHGCSCPECEPESDEHPLFVADEGHQVLSDSAGYYGVSSGGGW